MLWGQRNITCVGDLVGVQSGWGWDSNQFDPLQWFLVLLPIYHTGKGHQGFTRCLAWVYLALSVPAGSPGVIWQEFNHSRSHITGLHRMVSHWLFQNRAKQTHPSLQNLLSMKISGHATVWNIPCHEPQTPRFELLVCETPKSELDFQNPNFGIFPGNVHFKSPEVADKEFFNLQHSREWKEHIWSTLNRL